MKRLALCSNLALLLGILFPGCDARQSVARSLDTSMLAGSANALIIKNENGSIRLHANDSGRVTIHALLSTRAPGLLNEIAVKARVRDGEVIISATFPQQFADLVDACNIDYDISYPRGLAVSVSGKNGFVTVAGAAGDVSARLTNGGIAVENALSSLELSTRRGNVNATLSPKWQGHSISLSSSMGSVAILLPHDFHGYLNAKTRIGFLRNDSDLPVLPASGLVPLNASTDLGDVIIKRRG